MTSEQFVAKVADCLACDYSELMAAFIIGCEGMTLVSDELPLIIRQIRKRSIHVVIATDNMDCFTRWTVPALELDMMFDDILCSHELGCLKGDIDENGRSCFFVPYLERHIIGAAECLILDDSPSISKVASACGMECLRISSDVSLVTALRRVLTN